MKPELLSPAGNFEKLKAAVRYGADAVYLAGNAFGMRSAADNFTNEELFAAADYVHAWGKKLYLTVNTMPHGYEYPALREYLHAIADAGMDAMIVADLGVMQTVREILPAMPIHVSTQASIVSPQAARAYASLGASRLVLARELTLDEVRAIRAALPDSVELEAFIHGSMCVSYSGRCMLSNALTGRDGNRGACTQPCRWNYTLYEEKRPEQPIPIEENDLGTFIMSSKDMCMIEHVPELMSAGVASFKIEGRMKSAYYTAVVTNAYRMAIDAYLQSERDGTPYAYDPAWLRELESVSHREYAPGFWLESPARNSQLSTRPGYIRDKAYFAVAEAGPLPGALPAEGEEGTLVRFIQRNKICVGDHAEIITPGCVGQPFTVGALYDEAGESLPAVPHPSQVFFTYVPFPVKEGDILRAGDEETASANR